MVSSFSVFDSLEQLREQVLQQQQAIAKLTERVYALEHRPPDQTQNPAPAPPLRDVNIRRTVARSPVDWETLVGTNWLNRLGALVLVIGIALFLGYSLTQLGPAGKASIGAATGLAMLIGGVTLRKNGAYGSLAVSLAGGGWAAIYFTAYAVYALPAARLIEDPVTATLLLLVVSSAMVLHALLGRSETATGLAYLIGFASLNLQPLTTFAVAAMFILAISAVLVAHRFDWPRVAVVGAAFTYASFIMRVEDPVYHQPGVLHGQVALWVYWILFELYGIRSREERILFWVNAAGFLGSSCLLGWPGSAAHWANLLFAFSAAYAVSAILRKQREPAVNLSAWLLAGGLIERLSGATLSAALLGEGEALVWAGVYFKLPYLVRLGSFVLILPLIRMVVVDSQSLAKGWVLVALVASTFFLVQRWVYKMHAAYVYAAALLVGTIIATEFSRGWITVGLGAMALLTLVCGLLFRDVHTRYAGFLTLAGAMAKLFLHDLSALDTPSRILSFIILGLLLLGASWGYSRFLRSALAKFSGGDPVTNQAQGSDVV